MSKRPEYSLVLVSGLLACSPTTQAPAAQDAPEAIGPQLRETEGSWGLADCTSSRMFWDGRSVQYQCFDTNGLFAWENRGTLSTEATQLLEEAIANADLDATEPVNHEGGCGASDNGGSTTIWVDDEPLSFAPDCVFEGIASLYAHIQALAFEIQSCESVSMLASVDPDCRAY